MLILARDTFYTSLLALDLYLITMNFNRLHISLLVMFLATSVVAQTADSDTVKWSIDIDDVVVTAQYAPTDSRNAVQEIRTITKETILRRGANNLEQLLSLETNIRINQDAVLGSSMSLSGISGQNVKIMIDGVPVIGRLDGNVDLSQINLNQIERVEIVEGPLSVNYGTDALAGVINLITKKSQLKKNEIGLAAQIEDKGENSYTARFGSRLTDNLFFQVNGGYDDFNGFGSDSTRSVLWNPKTQQYADAGLRYTLNENQDFRYVFSWFDEGVSNLGDVRRPQFKPYAFDDFYSTNRSNHSFSYKGNFANKYFTQTTVGYNQFLRIKNTERINFDEESREFVNGQQDTSEFNGAMLRTVVASRYDHPLNFQLGADLRYDNGTGKRINDPLSEQQGFSEIGDYAFFGTLKYTPIQKLTLESGLRYAYNTRYEAPLIPSINLKYNLTKDWVVRGSFGQGFRSPDLKELFHDFVDVNHFIKGNPNLQAEKSDNFQVGFNYSKRKKDHRIDFKIKGFYNNIVDKIGLYQYKETPAGRMPSNGEATGEYTYFNQDVYKTQGGNLNLGYRLKNLGINAGLSTIGYYNQVSETFEDVAPFTYTFELSNELTYQFPKQKLNLSLFTRINDKQIEFYPEVDDNGNTIAQQGVTDGFTMMDFTITKSFWKQRFNLTAGVKNLLDIQQVNQQGNGGGVHAGTGTSAPISAGRNFFVRLGFDLGW